MKLVLGLMVLLTVFVIAGDLLAAEKAPAEGTTGEGKASSSLFFVVTVITGGFAMALASMFAALGQGKTISSAVESIARQPGASGKITTAMVIGLAMIESLAIYVLVIALILFFANPFIKYVVQ